MKFKQTDPSVPGDWFDLAEDRLKIADLAWKHEGMTAAGLECLQESAERYIKGFLVAKGWQLVKTHDLGRLLRDANAIDPKFKVFLTMANELTDDFFAQHYPGGDLTNLGQNYESMRAEVGQMIELIKTSLPQFFPK
jgi:HEPN domain-containing protein